MAADHDTAGHGCASSEDWPKPAIHAFQNAKAFFERFAVAVRIDDPAHVRLAAFDLHQCAEACYKAILLTLAGDCPACHYVRLLDRMLSRYLTVAPGRFPDREGLSFLDSCYTRSRYDERWQPDRDDLICLAARVQQLMNVAGAVVRDPGGRLTQ